MKAGDILATAANLVNGDRLEAHGDVKRCHDNIAVLWNGYLSIRKEPASPLTAMDVAHLMCLLKLARTQLGADNTDDWIDGTAYFALARELVGD